MPQRDRLEQRRRWVELCDRCGFPLTPRNCKEVCQNCGARLDCSDLPVVRRNRVKPMAPADGPA